VRLRAQVFERSGAGATLEVYHPFRSVHASGHLRSFHEWSIRPAAIARRSAQKAPVQVCLHGFSSIKLRAQSSLAPGRGTHRCVHVVTLRGGRTGRSEARSAHRHAPHTGCPARARGPGRGRYSLSGAALNLGPTRSDRHASAHHPLGRGGGILAAGARPRRRLTHWPGWAWPCQHWGSLRGLAGPLGVLEHRRTLCSCCVPMPKR
jgi:hypothetical protein